MHCTPVVQVPEGGRQQYPPAAPQSCEPMLAQKAASTTHAPPATTHALCGPDASIAASLWASGIATTLLLLVRPPQATSMAGARRAIAMVVRIWPPIVEWPPTHPPVALLRGQARQRQRTRKPCSVGPAWAGLSYPPLLVAADASQAASASANVMAISVRPMAEL
jgi:hypothetical protein